MGLEPKGIPPAAARTGARITRRSLLGWVSSASLLGSVIAGAVETLSFLKPRATYGQPHRFKIGRPEDFPPDTRTALEAKRLCVVREGNKVAVISTTCTHLGCIAVPGESGFACPCHGSQFDSDGLVSGGPAPRPLPRFQVRVTPSGELEVDEDAEVSPGTYLAL